MALGLGVLACSANGEFYGWDQCTGYTIDNGWAAQDFETAYDCYDCWAGDDFHVTDWFGLLVEEVHWIPQFTHGYATVNKVNFAIMKLDATGYGDFSKIIWQESGFHNQTLYSETQYKYHVSNPQWFPYGETYFFAVQVDMAYETWGQHYASLTQRDLYGVDASIANPNGCFGWGSDWFQPDPGYELMFTVGAWLVPEPGVISLAGVLLGAGALWLRRS